MTRIAYALVFMPFIVLVLSAPTTDRPNEDDKVIYDQRQNGTDNLRLQMNGVNVLIAPADAVLGSLDFLGSMGLLGDSQLITPKLANRPNKQRRIASLLMGLMKRHQE